MKEFFIKQINKVEDLAESDYVLQLEDIQKKNFKSIFTRAIVKTNSILIIKTIKSIDKKITYMI